MSARIEQFQCGCTRCADGEITAADPRMKRCPAFQRQWNRFAFRHWHAWRGFLAAHFAPWWRVEEEER